MSSVEETTVAAETRRLLERYRTLCEANGLARAHRTTLAPQASADLSRLEQEILHRLGSAAEAPAEAAIRPSQGVRSAAPRRRDAATPSGLDPVPPSLERAGPAVLEMPGGEKMDPAAATKLAATVYTDGSAEGNPGPGGYCALLRVPGRPDQELAGGERHTTNNKMELTAAIVGLSGAIEVGAAEITVITDSEYLVKGMTAWLSGWQKKGWKTATGQPVKNQELWQKLSDLTRGRSVRWQWVRGHAGHPENERCDAVATAAARKAARG